jgi:hypothetical protein
MEDIVQSRSHFVFMQSFGAIDYPRILDFIFFVKSAPKDFNQDQRAG